MTERPIIFSGEMVRAILAGRKSQTRRVLRPQPFHAARVFCEHGLWLEKHELKEINVPYRVGDRLWVRETFQIIEGGWDYGESDAVVYRADQPCATDRWRSPIHMPRWASRIVPAKPQRPPERRNPIALWRCPVHGAP